MTLYHGVMHSVSTQRSRARGTSNRTRLRVAKFGLRRGISPSFSHYPARSMTTSVRADHRHCASARPRQSLRVPGSESNGERYCTSNHVTGTKEERSTCSQYFETKHVLA